MKVDHRLKKTIRRFANRTFALVLAALLITTWACNKSGQAPSAGPGGSAALDRSLKACDCLCGKETEVSL
jgi:hypothetical protein